jgi:hypothetical protein
MGFSAEVIALDGHEFLLKEGLLESGCGICLKYGANGEQDDTENLTRDRAFKSPAILLSGVVDYDMYTKFRNQFDKASDQDLVVIELSTLGGDPEVARMMGEDVRFASEMES